MYKYSEIEGSDYPLFFFRSIDDHHYNLSFSEYYKIAGIPFYSIDIDCINHKKPKKDPLVGKTICMIIEGFLSKNNQILMGYVCDKSDAKELYRRRKFNSWNKLYSSGRFLMLNQEINFKDGNGSYYTSLIFDANVHPEDFIIDEYRKEIQLLSNK